LTILKDIRHCLRKSSFIGVLSKSEVLKNSQHFVDVSVQLKIIINNSHHTICSAGRKYLNTYSALGCTPKEFDFKMQLYPFEKGFYLPTIFIEEFNLFSRYLKIIGKIDKSSIQCLSIINYTSEFLYIFYLEIYFALMALKKTKFDRIIFVRNLANYYMLHCK